MMKNSADGNLFSEKRMRQLKSILDDSIKKLPELALLYESVEKTYDQIQYSSGGKNLFYRGYYCPQLSRLIARNVSKGKIINENTKAKKKYQYLLCKGRLLYCRRLDHECGQTYEEFIFTSPPFEISAIYVGSIHGEKQLSEVTICQYEENTIRFFGVASVSENREIGMLYIEDYQYDNRELRNIFISEVSTSDFEVVSRCKYCYNPINNEWNMDMPL